MFLSRPTVISAAQDDFCRLLHDVLRERGLDARTVGVSDFGNTAPLTTVRALLEQCRGAIILGLAQTLIASGARKAGTPQESRMRGVFLPTVWNQLEAGIAFALDLPLFIVRERSVSAEGIFDPQIGDRFVHQADLHEAWLDSDAFLQPFDQWVAEVKAH